MKNKTWKKPKIIQAEIGKCRYCYKIVFNTDSFVSFLSEDENGQREKAHHSCMKKDYYKNLINKNKDKEINNRLGWSTCLEDHVIASAIGWGVGIN